MTARFCRLVGGKNFGALTVVVALAAGVAVLWPRVVRRPACTLGGRRRLVVRGRLRLIVGLRPRLMRRCGRRLVLRRGPTRVLGATPSLVLGHGPRRVLRGWPSGLGPRLALEGSAP